MVHYVYIYSEAKHPVLTGFKILSDFNVVLIA